MRRPPIFVDSIRIYLERTNRALNRLTDGRPPFWLSFHKICTSPWPVGDLHRTTTRLNPDLRRTYGNLGKYRKSQSRRLQAWNTPFAAIIVVTIGLSSPRHPDTAHMQIHICDPSPTTLIPAMARISHDKTIAIFQFGWFLFGFFNDYPLLLSPLQGINHSRGLSSLCYVLTRYMSRYRAASITPSTHLLEAPNHGKISQGWTRLQKESRRAKYRDVQKKDRLER